MNIKNLFNIFFLLLLLGSHQIIAAVKLPKVFSDNMVLQRDKEVKIWGWAEKGEIIKVFFNGQESSAKADKKGRWMITLKPMAFGGPFNMTISGKSENQVLRNILIGDIWLASGQSNMEWHLENTNNAEEEIAIAANENIRIFTVEKTMALSQQEDLPSGDWKVCSPETIKEFSAVAYYFGKELHQELDIPVGLINASWGGTNIEAWLPWDEMTNFAEYKNFDIEKQGPGSEGNKRNHEAFVKALQNDKGVSEKWFEPSTDYSCWRTMELPTTLERSELGIVDGIVWFEKEFEIPTALANKGAILSLGGIDDEDVTYINGELVGAASGWNNRRVYEIEPSVLKSGQNTIVIKVTDHQSGGGIAGKPSILFIEVAGQKIPLAGTWKFKPSVLTSDFNVIMEGPNSFPSQLYNSMIAPLTDFSLKGFIWYQGESNTFNAQKYREYFTTLITSWRKKWDDNLPFFWVQLPNYMAVDEKPRDSNWAELREAQSLALKLPDTGQAVIIDLGEAEDIHPRNKKDVGHRLALNALKKVYDKDVIHSGPVYHAMKIEGKKIILDFSNTGSGLLAKDKYGYLKGFAIAGDDKNFIWANAYIENDKVVVYSNKVLKPLAVRYAWGNNPDDANLYNKEGLPASPFRTDNWKGITKGR